MKFILLLFGMALTIMLLYATFDFFSDKIGKSTVVAIITIYFLLQFVLSVWGRIIKEFRE